MTIDRRFVIGIDPSLTATGIAVARPVDRATVETIGSKGHKGDTVRQRWERIDALSRDIVKAARRAGDPDLVVIEAPAYGSKMGSMHDRSGLWWLVVDALLALGIPVAEVAPTARIRYALGSGRGTKEAVMAATIRRYPDVMISDDNEADALVLAAMGAEHLGFPLTVPPVQHRKALESVKWPPSPVELRLSPAVAGAEAAL